jgi:hypothetical protein
MMMMNVMANDHLQVWDHIANVIICSTISDPYIPLMAHVHLEMEQQLTNSKSFLTPPLALATSARPTPFRKASQKLCTSPKCLPK